MKDNGAALLKEYTANLCEYLEGGGEASLKKAYDWAREAMAKGVGVLEMAAVHHEAMARVMGDAFNNASGTQRILAAETFFVECLSPFEMTHRTFQESNVALRQINERFENEAKRIAHALHAESSQLLVSAYLVLESVSKDMPAEQRHLLAKVRALLDKTSEQIRTLSHELRPMILDDLGLMPALRFLAEGVAARSRISIKVDGSLETRPAPVIETAVYRAVQEALNNVMKHAEATTAVVHVKKDHGKLVCSVRDDGAGFDGTAAFGSGGNTGIGLLSIRERLKAVHGTLQINSAPDRGTDFIITIPMEE